jgi:iron complex transport system ATP-binding protein
MLAAEGLALGYPGRLLCSDLSVTFRPGECWGILGQNGSGKTTLLHALAGLAAPLAGSVRLDGKPLGKFGRRELARRIGLLLQEEESGFWGTVSDYVALGRFPHGGDGEECVAGALRRMELDGLAGRELATLSGGERQRARIAMLLAQQPDIFCLDEPLLHLDLHHQAEVMGLFRQLARAGGKTVLMVLHEPHWASRYCDHVLLLYDNGSIMNGTVDQLLSRERLENLYQCGLIEAHADRQVVFLPKQE